MEETKARWAEEQIQMKKKLLVTDNNIPFIVPVYPSYACIAKKSKTSSTTFTGASCTNQVPIPEVDSDVVLCTDEDGDESLHVSENKSFGGAEIHVHEEKGACSRAATTTNAAMSSDVVNSASGGASSSPPPPSHPNTHLPPLTVVAGIDISFVKDSDLAVASVAILSYPELKLLHTVMRHVTMTEPYIAGFLAFREVPLILPLLKEEVLDKLPNELQPQLIFVDGNGVHHPRKFGFASHLGVAISQIPKPNANTDKLNSAKLTSSSSSSSSSSSFYNIPTIGCAKNLLLVDDLGSNKEVDQRLQEWCFGPAGNGVGGKGPIMPLVGNSIRQKGKKCDFPSSSPSLLKDVSASGDTDDGSSETLSVKKEKNGKKTLWGYAALTGNSTKQPIYISPGHGIGFRTAAALTIACTLFRVPEPIRQADLLSREYIRKNFPTPPTPTHDTK